ncbi:MAG TPA: response regulator [Polyangiaceae bacterium]|nr:response regulator [Polyangiaceae bacterium]
MSAQVKRSLKSKLLAITASIMLLMSAVILGAVAWMNYVTENERLADVEQQIRQSIASRGTTLAESHAIALKGLVADNAFSDVRKLVSRAVEQEDMVYGAFIGSENQAWAYVAPTTRNLEKSPPGAHLELKIPARDLESKQPLSRSTMLFGKAIQEFSAPVSSEEDERLGRIVYGLSTERLSRAVAAARDRSERALGRALWTIGIFGMFSLGLGILLVRRAAAHITRPIAQLTAAANEIAKGERGIRAQIHSGDEVEVLSGAFNHMLQANEEAMERLEVTTKRALEADRLKSEFLANMSHEIRTPMNGVLGVVKLMQAQPLDNKLWRYVETIDASANALLTIINDILDFSKLEAGKYTIQDVPFQPKVVVQEVAELLAARAHDKNLELVYRTDLTIPSFAVGDPDRLKQVLTNLVGNAIKFTDTGEVFINMTVASRDSQQVVIKISVHDSGVGIDSGHLPKLYDVFSQADGSTVRKHGGTGLGLAICKRLLKMMGGDIEVQSKVGQGSVFTFTVTLGVDSRDMPSNQPLMVTGKRVLVAEASRWRDIIAEHLQVWEMNHEMLDRGSAVLEALERARTAKQSFDAVVIGSELGDIKVPDLIRSIRAHAAFKTVPIIVLSKVQADSGLSELERDGVLQLHKPIRFSELYNCLASSVSSIRQASVAQLQPLIHTMSSKRVLVVDDNEINQFVAVEQLEQLGYRADVAGNGLEAFEKVKRGGYAAVLMDCQMPVMDGYTATGEIRRWEAEQGDGRHVPVIALTAHALQGERERVLNAGMDDYLSKPCRPSALEKLLRLYTQSAEDGSPSDAPTAASPAATPELSDDPRSEKLIRLFLSRFPNQLQELGKSIDKAEAPEVRAHAHKLKGGCLVLGATIMAKLAEKLQKDAEAANLSDAPQLVADLRAHYQTVEGLLKKELAELEARKKPSIRPN